MNSFRKLYKKFVNVLKFDNLIIKIIIKFKINY